jgi:hypothetical protein
VHCAHERETFFLFVSLERELGGRLSKRQLQALVPPGKKSYTTRSYKPRRWTTSSARYLAYESQSNQLICSPIPSIKSTSHSSSSSFRTLIAGVAMLA